MTIANTVNNVYIIAKESFEFVLLQSEIFKSYKKRVNGYPNDIESKDFFSWERYFTWLIHDITKSTVMQYSKNSLNSYYSTEKSVQAVFSSLDVLER